MASSLKRSASVAGIAVATDARRVRELRGGNKGWSKKTVSENEGGKRGPVLYWCERDKRVGDNWALVYASEVSRKLGVGLAVVVSLADDFWDAGARHSTFALEGLRDMHSQLETKRVPLFLLQGEPHTTISELVQECGAGLLVCDFSPLRTARNKVEKVLQSTPSDLPVHQVDAHNVVPLWVTSEKQEYAARTIRPKINRVLHNWLVDIPSLAEPAYGREWDKPKPVAIDWDSHIKEASSNTNGAKPLSWCSGGETEGRKALQAFLGSDKRLSMYESSRNDPTKSAALSGLSPWINFGFLSAQRAAFEAQKLRKQHAKSVDGFTEELVIRRELSDNFCYYNKNYDSIKGASEWAQESLKLHAMDSREYVYKIREFEYAKTHDNLWNAAQLELVYYGKMHGFMRMYWAKKILEWSATPEDALETAIYLNDKYSIDGRDPNGYVGCMWSVCGIHDMGWTERKVFGKIRYMNYAGCKRKFNIDGYVNKINKLVFDIRKEEKLRSA